MARPSWLSRLSGRGQAPRETVAAAAETAPAVAATAPAGARATVAADAGARLDDVLPPPPERKDFEVGDVLVGATRYEVLDVKMGGFGAVYIVRELDGDSDVRRVLKTFQARFLWSDDDRARFEREMLTWVLLGQHPHIVTAFGVERIEGFPCIKLDYLTGGDLAQLLERGVLSPRRAAELALQVCDAMAYAFNALGLVHRDIKPANCLLTDDGRLEMTDFGLARAFSEAQEQRAAGAANAAAGHTTAAGTRQYMAPEQFRPDAVLDTRTDIHAFGVMLYEMLTGDLPFAGSVAHAHILENAPAFPLGDDWLPLILQCTESDPARRPARFETVRQAIAAIYERLAGEPAPPPAEPTPMSKLSWKFKGRALWNLHRAADALECFEQALRLDPEDAVLWHLKGLALGDLGRFQDQDASYARALTLEPGSANILHSRAICQLRIGGREDALRSIERALVLRPDVALFWDTKGKVLAELGRRDEALAALDRGLELNPRDTALLQNRAVTLIELGREGEAIECFERMLQINPRDANLWNSLGNSMLRRDRFQEALDCYRRGLAIQPEDPELLNGLGGALASLGRPEEALDAFDRGLAIAPDHEILRENRGLMLQRMGAKPQTQAAEPQPTVASDTNDLDAWLQKGAALYGADRHEEALACFERAIQIAPDNPFMWSNKAAVFQMLKRHHEALACYDRALQLDPHKRQLWESKIKLLSELKRHAELVAAYEGILAIAPADVELWTQKGAVLYGLERYADALTCFQRCLDFAPANANFWSNKGTALLALKRFDEALTAYDEGLRLNPGHAGARQGRSAALTGLGRIED